MTIKELKELLANSNDDDKLEVVDGKLTLVKDKPIEYKYNVGEAVVCKDGGKYKIIGLSDIDGTPGYHVLGYNGLVISEALIVGLEPQSITDRIKTFDDAVEWCKENKPSLYLNWKDYFDLGEGDEDIVAYLKLRIITAALNEGWEPMEEDLRYVPVYTSDGKQNAIEFLSSHFGDSSSKLCFKSEELAIYAATQFRDIYADFCGSKKGGEK